MPTRKYTFAPEIFGHARRIAEHFGLYEHALFSTEVTGLEWDSSASRWIVRTDRGDELRARFVTMGTGPLHRPKLPGIPGIETFDGHSFHTSRWDYAYTGGNPRVRPMVGLADKRVGIIGTGATAVQCIPHLARDAGELFVFQRTPSSIDVRNNQVIDPEWFATLEPGWQAAWLANFAILQTGGFADEDLVHDGWTDISQRIRDRVVADMGEGAFGPEAFRRAYEDSDDEKMTEIRARVDAIVEDPATAGALMPWYRQLCKRPCFHDEYLQAYNEPGVHLVDTDGRGVERIDASGVWVAGVHYPLDWPDLRLGLRGRHRLHAPFGLRVVGRDGTTLSEHWADGMQTLHGLHRPRLSEPVRRRPGQAATSSRTSRTTLTEAATTIALVVARALQLGAAEVEVSDEAEQAWWSSSRRPTRRCWPTPTAHPATTTTRADPWAP